MLLRLILIILLLALVLVNHFEMFSIYNTKINNCKGKKDGVSGCRKCCSQFTNAITRKQCIALCMT